MSDQELGNSFPETRPSSPQYLLLDIGNVLIASNHNITHKYLEQLGVSPEDAETYFTIPEYAAFSRGEIDSHTFCDALRTTLQTPSLTDKQLHEAHDMHQLSLIQDMQELLTKLTQKYGHAFIVFVTDTNPWQTARQQQLIDLSEYTVFTSDTLHMLKSDPESTDPQGNSTSFFLSVAKQLGVQLTEMLLVDDSPEKIEIATRYGMQTIRFEDETQLASDLAKRGI